MARPKRKLVKIEVWAEMSAQASKDLKANLKDMMNNVMAEGELTYLAIDITDRG